MNYWSMHDWMEGGWPMGGLFWIVILALIAYAAYVYLPRAPLNRSDAADGSSGALRTLDERYAKSEIEREEYLRRKRDILGKGEI